MGELFEERGAPLPAIGRNGACPCGSGRKAKRCHAGPGLPPDGAVAIFSGSVMMSVTGSWDGSPVPLRVYLDAGAGDAIHAFRYARWLASRQPTAFVSRPSMTSLFRAAAPELTIEDRWPLTPAAAHAASLGLLRRAMKGQLPRERARPYLAAPDPVWPAHDGLRHLGLALRGDSSQAMDRWRSIHDERQAAPLLELRGVAWHRLDVPPFGTWLDTANRVAGLEAVVAVDTGVAHLAGALGVPVYLLNRAGGEGDWGPDDRWDEGFLQPGPIYRGVRVFRQADREKGWGDAAAACAAALAR